MPVNMSYSVTLRFSQFAVRKNGLAAVLFMQNYSTSHKISFVNLMNII